MRSRDGNISFLLRFCTVVILSSFASLNAKEFLISYRYVVKDAALYNETLHISSSMQKCVGTPQESLILTNYKNNDLKKTIRKNSKEFIEFLHKLGLSVKHREKTTNYLNSSTTILTLKTTCFKVDFNDNFAKITPLK